MRTQVGSQKHAKHIAPLLCIALLKVSSGSLAALYRWTDDDGIVHYTDTLPPDFVGKARTEFNEQGLVIRKVPRAKTPEEIRQEQELKRLRTHQERLLGRLWAENRVLLRTFRSEADLLRALDEKLDTIDLIVQVNKNNIHRQEAWLEDLRSQAADFERAGKPVPPHLRSLIQKTKDSIRAKYQAIAKQERKRKAIQARFQKDLKRFRQLQAAGSKGGQLIYRPLEPILHEIVSCKDRRECDRLWQQAKAYLYPGEGFEFQTDKSENVLFIAPFGKRKKANLILARVPDQQGQGASLFLELRCQQAAQGKQSCESPELVARAEHFRKALDSATLPNQGSDPLVREEI